MFSYFFFFVVISLKFLGHSCTSVQELHALDTINFSTSQAFNSLTASISECALMIMKSIAYSSHTIKEKSKKGWAAYSFFS